MTKKRTVVISTSRLNRKGFRVLSTGIDVEQYKKNPVLLWMHNRPWRGTKDEVMPLGTVKDIRLEGDQWVGELDFDMDDPFAAKVAQKWDKGIYQMVSCGLTPVEFSEAEEHILPGQRYATLSKSRLDEISVVDIGANDDALSIKNNDTGNYVMLNDKADMSFLPLINPISNNKNSEMKNIAIKLGLAADASEEQILAAIKERDNRIVELQSNEAAIRLQAITSAVDSAIKEKRITQAQKDHFVKLGQTTNLETLQQTLSFIEPVTKPSELIKPGGQEKKVELTDKKWADLKAEEIEKLKSEQPDQYKLMFEKEYGFMPSL